MLLLFITITLKIVAFYLDKGDHLDKLNKKRNDGHCETNLPGFVKINHRYFKAGGLCLRAH